MTLSLSSLDIGHSSFFLLIGHWTFRVGHWIFLFTLPFIIGHSVLDIGYWSETIPGTA